MIAKCSWCGSVNIAKAGSSRHPARCSVNDFPVPSNNFCTYRRHAERPGDIVQIETGVAEASRDLRQDRLQPGCLHTTVRNDVCSFGGRPERRGHEIEEMYADGGGQFW